MRAVLMRWMLSSRGCGVRGLRRCPARRLAACPAGARSAAVLGIALAAALTRGICWVRGLRCLSRRSFSFSLTLSRGDSWAPAGRIVGAQFLLRLQHVLQQAAQFGADVVAGGDFAQRDAQRGQFPGEVLGVGEVAFGPLAVLLERDAVAVVLPVLGQQQQRARRRRPAGTASGSAA